MKVKNLLYLVGFIEGGALMSLELMSSRLISTGFGSSTQVWALVLSVTLFALAFGYYFGGLLSKNKIKRVDLLAFITLIACCYIFFLPEINNFITNFSIKFTLFFGTLILSIFLIFPPIFLFGTVSPLVIDLINSNSIVDSGKTSGLVYGISTIGGIISTFIFGLYLIPLKGVRFSCYVVSISLFLAFLITIYIRIKKIFNS
jgi:MFS family permease